MSSFAPPQIADEWFRAIFIRNPHPMWFVDLHTQAFLDINEAATEWYGYSRDELLSMKLTDLCASAENSLLGLTHLLQSAGSRVNDIRIRKKDGQIIHADLLSQSLNYEDRTAVFLTSISITKPTETESDLNHLFSKYRPLVENQPDTLIRLDVHGNFTSIVPSASQRNSFNEDRIIGKNIKDFVLEDDWNLVKQMFQAALKGEVVRFEAKAKCRNGMTIWQDSIYFPVLENGQITAVSGLVRDLTEQRLAERGLIKKTEELQRALRAAEMILWEWNTETNQFNITGDPSCVFGDLDIDPATPSTFYEHFVDEDLKVLRKQMKKAIIDNAPFKMECRVIWRDGSYHWLVVKGHPFCNPDQQTCIAGMSIDVTQRKTIEDALEQNKEYFRIVAEITNDLLWEWDLQSNKVIWKGDFEKIFGTWKGRVPETYEENIKYLHPDDADRVKTKLSAAFENHASRWTDEYRFKCANGKYAFIQNKAAILYDDDGRPIKAIGALVNITEKRLAEETLKTSHAELEIKVAERTEELRQSNRKLRRLSKYLHNAREDERARVARDIHDELGGILAALKFDLGTRNPPLESTKQRNAESSALVDSAIQSLRRIITDLRPPILDDLGLWETLEWLIQDFQEHWEIKSKLTLKTSNIQLPSNISVAIFRIMQELLTNVAKHSKATEVHISAQLTDAKEIKLNVRDNGVGIQKRNLKGEHNFGILGIQERVRILNGKVRFRGRPGYGTTITVRIPCSL